MIVLHTLTHRWWALIFIPAFFWVAAAERSWRAALRFLAVASTISFGAEYLSTHTGFPYGRYDYIANTHGSELYISNVPIFVPLTFGTVIWAGRALINKANVRPATLIVGGALFAAAIDLVIDPMTLRGGTWFLGRLYAYRAGGPWFDVPLSNYAGWILAGAIILVIDEAFEARARKRVDTVRGPLLAFGTCGFFIVIALATSHWAIAGASVGVTIVMISLARARLGGTRAEQPVSSAAPPARL
jgi:putative membrane protein